MVTSQRQSYSMEGHRRTTGAQASRSSRPTAYASRQHSRLGRIDRRICCFFSSPPELLHRDKSTHEVRLQHVSDLHVDIGENVSVEDSANEDQDQNATVTFSRRAGSSSSGWKQVNNILKIVFYRNYGIEDAATPSALAISSTAEHSKSCSRHATLLNCGCSTSAYRS